MKSMATPAQSATRGLAGLALFVVAAALPLRPPAHADDAAKGGGEVLAVRVATTVVPDDPVLAPPEKGAAPKVARPLTHVELAEGSGLGLAAPEGGRAWRGGLDVAGKRRDLVVLRASDGPCVLVVDGDGDGRCDAAKERHEAAATTEGAGFRARFADVALHRGRATVTVEHRTAAFTGTIQETTARGEPQKPATTLALSSERPEGVGEVEGWAEGVRWAVLELAGAKVVVAVRRHGDEGLDVLVGDPAELATAARPTALPAVRPQPLRRGDRRIGTRWTAAGVPAGGAPRTIVVMETLEHATASVAPAGVRRGAVEVEGRPHVLHLLDADFDGAFAGEDDRWWFGPDAAAEALNVNTMTEGDAPGLLEGGRVWDLGPVGPDGTATLTRSHRPDAVHATLHRRAERVNAKRWFPRFAADTEFGRTYPTDPSRPLATSPAPFRFALSLDEGLALAKAEGKPLLVDFEADWCVWCKRLDYHTYPDAEVVEALKAFTCVKVNNDLDPTRSFRKLAWQGIPALGVFDAAGKPVRFTMPPVRGQPATEVDRISGFLPPAALVAALKAAHTACVPSPAAPGNAGDPPAR